MIIKHVLVGGMLVYFGISTACAEWTLLGLDTDDSGVTLTVSEVEVSPTNSNVIYAYTRPNGLYRSGNNGASWDLVYEVNKLNHGLQVISDSVVFIGVSYGFKFTTDAGQTWNDIPVDIPSYIDVRAFHVNPDNVDDITILVSAVPYIFNTTDGGATWNPVIASVADSIDAKEAWISKFLFTDTTYYVGVSTSLTNGAMADSGFYYSTDQGQNWVQSLDSIGTTFDMTVAYNNPNVAMAAGYGGPTDGTFITVDGGVNWTKLANLRYGPLVVMDDPLSGVPVIYSGAGEGVRKAIGNCWRSMQDGLPTTVGFQEVSDIEIDPNDSSRLLLATRHGVFTQHDTGQFDNTDCVAQFENEIPSVSNSTTDTKANPTTSDSGGGGGSLDVVGLLMLFGFRLVSRGRLH